MTKIAQPRQTPCQCKGCRINRLPHVDEEIKGILARQAEMRRAFEEHDAVTLGKVFDLDLAAHEAIARFRAEVERIRNEPGGDCLPAEAAQ
jgi:hypothetical protein